MPIVYYLTAILTISVDSEVYSLGPIVAFLWRLRSMDSGRQFKGKAIQVMTFSNRFKQ